MPETHPITVDSLLAETHWLRALSSQLVRGNDRAEDLFQETVLASIRDRTQARGPLRPWLASVARHLAGRRNRTEVRRRQREEAVARSEAVPSTADAAARFAMHRSVVEAVEHLAEPYRTVILLRYWDDMPPREIAKRLGIPVETAKTRVKRALHQLRDNLDDQHGDRASWVAAMLPTIDRANAPAALAGGGALASVWLIGLPVAGAVVVLGALAWGLPFGNGSSRTDAAALAADLDSAGNEAPTDESSTDSTVSSVDATNDRQPLPVGETPAAILDGIDVRVVDAATGAAKPVVGVFYLDEQKIPHMDHRSIARTRMQVLRGEIDLYQMIRRMATPFVTDDRGHVTVPRPVQFAFVYAMPGELDGRVVLRREEADEKHVLELHPRISFPFEVRDRAGAAAGGIPVGWTSPQGRSTHVVRSDAAGRGLLQMPFFLASRPSRKGAVGIHLPLVPPAAVAIDLDDPPDQPVRLTLPPTGAVEVAAVDEKGDPVPNPATVTLFEWLPATGAVGGGRREDGRKGRKLGESALDSGVAAFARVGLGARLVVSVSSPRSVEPMTTTGWGPRESGHTVRLVVRPGAAERRIKFRVVDRTGEPVARTAFFVRCSEREGGRQRVYGAYRTSDADGKVVVALQEWRKNERVLEIWKASARRSATEDVTARFELSRPVALGTNYLPDVRLAPAPFIAGGVVVDAAGRAVEGAEVELACPAVLQPSGVRQFRSLPGQETVTTGPEGTFEFRGFCDHPRLRASARKPGHDLRAPVDVELGASDLTLVLARGEAGRGQGSR